MLIQKQVKSVLNKHKQRDSWFLDDYSVNPYEGCSCNCQYCYVRGSHYEENMADKLSVKTNALEVLAKQLAARAKKSAYGYIAVGSATDAYIPHESTFMLTRGMLQLFLQYKFPVFISTKCTLIKRDLDILADIDRKAILPPDLAKSPGRGVILAISLSTMNESIASTLEPGAASVSERLRLVKDLKEKGFLVGVNAIPLLPFISDTDEELEKIIAAAKAHDADFILAGSLTLFGNDKGSSRVLYYKFLERFYPSLLPKYNALFGSKHYVPLAYQQELAQRANKISEKYSIRNSIRSK